MKTYKVKYNDKDYELHVPDSDISKCSVGCSPCHGKILNECPGLNNTKYIRIHNCEIFEKCKKYISDGNDLYIETETLPTLDY